MDPVASLSRMKNKRKNQTRKVPRIGPKHHDKLTDSRQIRRPPRQGEVGNQMRLLKQEALQADNGAGLNRMSLLKTHERLCLKRRTKFWKGRDLRSRRARARPMTKMTIVRPRKSKLKTSKTTSLIPLGPRARMVAAHRVRKVSHRSRIRRNRRVRRSKAPMRKALSQNQINREHLK